jgi:hypothetical protein
VSFVTLATATLEPTLPTAVGPLSAAVLEVVAGRPPRHVLHRVDAPMADADPYGLDLQLALHVCYELHYRGFAGVDGRWEWNPGLLHLRAALEERFEDALHREVGEPGEGETASAEMAELSIEPINGEGLSYFLRDEGTWEQMREYFVHRSIYHLKEADPHAWLIPRLTGHAKAAFVAVEFDEYGGGHGDRLHQKLFADLLAAARLDSGYLSYLNHVPAESLTVVNLMSMFGLHRVWRGAAVGHFASTEITSPPGSYRLVQALERMKAPTACVRFYAEHVEADAVHEQVVRTDVVGDLVAQEPQLDRDVVFGIRARDLVEERLSAHMMKSWVSGVSSLRRPVD